MPAGAAGLDSAAGISIGYCPGPSSVTPLSYRSFLRISYLIPYEYVILGGHDTMLALEKEHM